MGLYAMLFGQGDNADELLGLLGLTRNDFYRYRDCYREGDLIAVYTRGGGNNRECWEGSMCADDNHLSSCVVSAQSKLREHPLYEKDEDDDFDNTYATFYFRFPDEPPQHIEPEVDRDEAWRSLLNGLK